MNAPTIYQTHPVSLEYIGHGLADPDPLDAGNWLIPAHAYLEQPPVAAEGYAVVREGEQWVLVADRRGTVYSTETGEPVAFDELGELPAGLTEIPPPSPAHHWANDAWALDIEAQAQRVHDEQVQAINHACESAITNGFWSTALGPRHHYSSRLDDQLNLTGAVLRGLDMSYACRDEQGVKAFRPHTYAQLRQVGDDFTLYKLQLLQRADELKQQLDLALAAGDTEAMELISWEAVQP